MVTGPTTVLFAGGNSSVPANSAGTSWLWKPEDYAVYSRPTTMRLALAAWTGAVAPACDLYVCVFAVASVAGSGTTHAVTLGAEVPGSRSNTVSLSAASSTYEMDQEFAAPARGWYAAAMVFSGAMAVLSHLDCSGGLHAFNP